MADLGRKYGAEWRTVLVEEERVRMDGCYIAVCHYMCEPIDFGGNAVADHLVDQEQGTNGSR